MSPTLLVALDGSIRARGVFDAAAGLARALGARLVLYRGVPVPPDYSPAGMRSAPELPKYLVEEAGRELLALRQRAEDLVCDIRVEQTNQPWQAILDAGDAVDADLIVLGSHGYRGWDHVLGTTAGNVANRARRNVMIIHKGDVTSVPPVRKEDP